MGTCKWIRFVLLVGLMLSLPQSNASAVTIDLRPGGPTTFDIGATLDVDVFILLNSEDQAVGIDAVTMQLEYGGGVVTVTGSGVGSPFSPMAVNPIPPQPGNPFSDQIAFSGSVPPLNPAVTTAEAFVGSLTLTGAMVGSYDLVARRFGSFPLFTSRVDPSLNRYDFTSDESLRITIVPEPGTLVLLGASLAGLAFLRRRVA